MTTTLRAAAVVVSYRSESCLESCLVRLLACDPERLVAVVVVDNASDDASASVARDVAAGAGGRVVVATTTRNEGYAAGANRGADLAARAADPDVFVFVNPDCRVRPGWLAPLLDAFADPVVAVAGSRLLESDGVTVQHAGGVVGANGLTRHRGRGLPASACDADGGPIDYVCGASMAVRACAWRRAGGFDERFRPAYFEEVDLCLRLRDEGLRTVYVAASEAVHDEAASSGGSRAAYLGAYHRNRLRFVARHLIGRGRTLAWLRAEVSWLGGLRTKEEVAPVLAAYASLGWPALVAATSRREAPKLA